MRTVQSLIMSAEVPELYENLKRNSSLLNIKISKEPAALPACRLNNHFANRLLFFRLH